MVFRFGFQLLARVEDVRVCPCPCKLVNQGSRVGLRLWVNDKLYEAVAGPGGTVVGGSDVFLLPAGTLEVHIRPLLLLIASFLYSP